MEVVGVEHSDQLLLHAGMSGWRVRCGFAVNGAEEDAVYWCCAARRYWIHYGGMLSVFEQA